MLLQYSLGEPEAAAAIEAAVTGVLSELRTPDIYEDGCRKVGTKDMGNAVAARL
jgi:3-isopropylmalate dehydrogenase